ncbi:unnamed protein product [Closterium sp. Naga37s-1]|nr:unnamed protein product [Closterium sp. Naga37s-1]
MAGSDDVSGIRVHHPAAMERSHSTPGAAQGFHALHSSGSLPFTGEGACVSVRLLVGHLLNLPGRGASKPVAWYPLLSLSPPHPLSPAQVFILWFDIFSIFQDEEQALIRASSSIPPQFAQSSLTQNDSPPSSPAAVAAGESAQQHTDTTPASSPATANTASDGSEPSAEPAVPDSSSGGAGHSGLSSGPEGGDIAHMFRPAEWRQHTFRRVGLVSFAQFSGYRVSPTQFAAVGLAARALDEGRKVGKCAWEPGKPAGGGQGESSRGDNAKRGASEGGKRRRRLMVKEVVGERKGLEGGGKGERRRGGERKGERRNVARAEGRRGEGKREEERWEEWGTKDGREEERSRVLRRGKEGKMVGQESKGGIAAENFEASQKRRQLEEGGGDAAAAQESGEKAGGGEGGGEGAGGNGSSANSPDKSPESDPSVNGEKPGESREEEEERREEAEEEERGWIHGSVEVLHVGEHHWWKYAGLILLCTLKREAYVAEGGWLHMRIDGEDVVVYEEEAGEVVNAVPHPPFLHNITHCSPPIHHQVRAERVRQWMDLHIRMGVDHYVLYDVGGVDLQLRSVLQPFLDGGIVEVTDFRDVVNYESWYYGQVMIVNDCVYRFRRLSKWLMYLDFDEFIFIDGQERVPNPMSVHEFLAPHEGLPYVSHGCLWWDHERCLPAQGDNDPRWPLERMLWHWPFIYCQAKDNTTDPSMCLNHWGHRKLFVDPRKVRVVENHIVADPRGGGKDLPTDALRHHHFRGIIKYGASECSLGMKADDPIEWWAHGTEEADRMHYVRTHPLDVPSLVAQHKWWRDYVLRTQRGQ